MLVIFYFTFLIKNQQRKSGIISIPPIFCISFMLFFEIFLMRLIRGNLYHFRYSLRCIGFCIRICSLQCIRVDSSQISALPADSLAQLSPIIHIKFSRLTITYFRHKKERYVIIQIDITHRIIFHICNIFFAPRILIY